MNDDGKLGRRELVGASAVVASRLRRGRGWRGGHGDCLYPSCEGAAEVDLFGMVGLVWFGPGGEDKEVKVEVERGGKSLALSPSSVRIICRFCFHSLF